MVALVQTWTFAGKENVSRFYLTYNITYLMAIPKAVLLKDTEYRKNTLQNAELLIKEKKKISHKCTTGILNLWKPELGNF